MFSVSQFSITHTNKTTAKQIKPSLREHLKLTNESQVLHKGNANC
jgi:hypothetical protein